MLVMITNTRRWLKRFAISGALAAALAITGATTSLAASNPSGTGQPNQSCGSATASVEPNGFSTTGFAHAETQYAGSGMSLDHAQSSHAVSQYDVACFQVTQNSH